MAGIPFLYKGASSGGAHPGAATILQAADQKYSNIFVADADGKPIEQFQYDTTPHVPEPGHEGGELGHKWILPHGGYTLGNNFLIGLTDASGSTKYVKIGNGAGEFRGHIDDGEGSIDKPAVIPTYGKQPTLDASGKPLGGNYTGNPQFAPGQSGYGVFPAYLGDLFPKADLVKTAPYNFTDPMEFAKKFGDFNRGEEAKNFAQSQDMALKELDTELKGMESFTPAAAALKRNQTATDNTFNQTQRIQQIDANLPGVRDQLNAQGSRAELYANGQAPDAVTNAGLDLSTRSAAADRAAGGGFGTSSSASRRISDLMSADQRIALSKYGDQLLSGNIAEKANLELAPTEYSNAGAQISVNPSLSTSQLTGQNLNALNGIATIPATSALASETQQNQFTTGLEQQTRLTNSAATNNFALDKFGYQASYAGIVAGAGQTDINTQLALQQQQQYLQLMQQYMQMAQTNGLISSGSGLLGGLLGSGGGSSILSGVGSLFGKGGSAPAGNSLGSAGAAGAGAGTTTFNPASLTA